MKAEKDSNVRAEDFPWLEVIAHEHGDGTSVQDLLTRIEQGSLAMWRFSSTVVQDEGGVMTCSVQQRPAGQTLFIEGLAGRGFVRWRYALCRFVRDIAREAGCERIEMWTARPGMKRLLTSVFKAREVTTVYRLEV